MKKTIRKAFEAFDIRGEFDCAKRCGNGNINNTYHITAREEGVLHNYIFQRINTSVFTEPDKLMHNLVRVVDHHRAALAKSGVEDLDKRVLKVFKTRSGEHFYTDSSGNCWRCHLFIDGKTHESLEDPEKLFNIAYAYGSFISNMEDFQDELHETIPNFHDGKFRLRQLEQAAIENRAGRLSSVQEWVDFVFENSSDLVSLQDKIETGIVPLRITHNDAKINNVILDKETGRPLCVIDLDTVMKGSVLFDFGDMIRSAANTVSEESPEQCCSASLDIKRFECLLEGFMQAGGDVLVSSEIEHINQAVRLLSLMIGTRFLTDYINGDVYFKIRWEDHNFTRALNNLHLYASIKRQSDHIDNLIRKYTPSCRLV
ncbi:aminoglycoside phosphotransferase family protein [Sedimentisphaera cyanobacteriorum]|uniref:aminoglycoside phosphotransferase family protein n=1 Tax=Sedimentisphaera cyanobacteriorum TaxID=1940790 RepID=UPI00137304B7|nr:aminoglycoside phosphotransferase family protein [Sedimentisphaera cyanobacteriorum]